MSTHDAYQDLKRWADFHEWPVTRAGTNTFIVSTGYGEKTVWYDPHDDTWHWGYNRFSDAGRCLAFIGRFVGSGTAAAL